MLSEGGVHPGQDACLFQGHVTIVGSNFSVVTLKLQHIMDSFILWFKSRHLYFEIYIFIKATTELTKRVLVYDAF